MVNRGLHLLLVLSIVSCSINAAVPAQVATSQVAAEDAHIHKKRAGPEAVSPIVIGAVQYEAVNWGKAQGLPQNGGYVRAVDVATGRALWLLRVYEVHYDSSMEGDKQDEFIASLAADEEGKILTVVTDRGARYQVDIAGQSVRK